MTTTQLIEPLSSIDTPPGILLPDPERLFARRQKRFAALAAGHALGDWLAYLGRLTGAQHECCLSIAPDLPLPPLQGEGRGGDGVKEVTSPRVIAARNPIPHLTSPLKGEEPRITQDADADAPHLTSPLKAFPYTQLELHKPAL